MTTLDTAVGADSRALPARRPSVPNAGVLAGTMRLVLLVLRRDRLRLALWIAGLVGLTVVSAIQIADLYDTESSRQAYVRTVGDNPALVMFAGPGYGFDEPSTGAVLVNETSLWMALACSLMSMFVVTRHTRAEEENERIDLVRSTVVGRHAPTTAALAVAAATNLLVGTIATVGVVVVGFPLSGSIALCASFAMVGLVFSAVAAIAAQIAPTSRSTLGLTGGLVGLAFVVRGVGDIAAPPMSWITPYGWGIGVRAYADERWWTLAGLAAQAVLLTGVAFALSVRRDLGAGLLRSRPGPAAATASMTTPLGLAVRMQRGTIAAWSLGVGLTGLVYGSIGDDIEDMLRDNPELAEFLARLGGGSVADAYLATALSMLAMLAAGFAVSSALRSRSEETAGRAEAVLATAVDRRRWAGAQVVVSVVASSIVVAAGGLGTGIGYATVTGDISQVPRMVGAASATLPAVLVLAGVATLLFGLTPTLTTGAWVVYAAVVAVGILGEVLGLPAWVLELSPFARVPAMPVEPFAVPPVAAVSAAAVALFAVGVGAFARRDLAP